MPVELDDMPRPAGDNGRGLHGFPRAGWTGGAEGLEYWVAKLVEMQIKWFKVLDSGGDSLSLCEKLLDAGIFPIVRVLRNDPPPNNTPEPNPGHIGDTEEKALRRLVAAGVRYFETNNEPDRSSQWKHGAMPGETAETARLVALNWLFDARTILEAGGCPGLPAVSSASDMDLIGALVALGRQEILLEGCWIALHNHCVNRPLAYPDDPVNRSAQPLTPEQFECGPMTTWTWWNIETGTADTMEGVNEFRAQRWNRSPSILRDHGCFRAFEFYDHLAKQYLGRSIPIISTDGGYQIGRRDDPRFGRVTPELHRDQTVAIYDFMQRQAPEYYFAAVPRCLTADGDDVPDAWYGVFWENAFRDGTDGTRGLPTISVSGISIKDQLPVVDAVKSMPSIVRRQRQLYSQTAATPSASVSGPDTQADVVASEHPDASPIVLNAHALATEKEITTEQSPSPELAADMPVPDQVLLDELRDQFYPARAAPGVHPEDGQAAQQVQQAAAVESGSASSDTDGFAQDTETHIAEPVNQAFAHMLSEGPAPAAESHLRQSSTPNPPENKVAAPPPSLRFGYETVPELDWDPRLDALHISVVAAQVATGQAYWKLVRAEFLGPTECDGKHLIYYVLEDDEGKRVKMHRVWQGWPEDRTDATTNDSGEASIPLWASFAPERGEHGPYSAWVDDSASERVTGLGLPSKRHVSFSLTWRRTRA